MLLRTNWSKICVAVNPESLFKVFKLFIKLFTPSASLSKAFFFNMALTSLLNTLFTSSSVVGNSFNAFEVFSIGAVAALNSSFTIFCAFSKVINSPVVSSIVL